MTDFDHENNQADDTMNIYISLSSLTWKQIQQARRAGKRMRFIGIADADLSSLEHLGEADPEASKALLANARSFKFLREVADG